MSEKSIQLIERIADMGLAPSSLKAVIMDYHARKRLTHDEVTYLFKKYRLSGV